MGYEIISGGGGSGGGPSVPLDGGHSADGDTIGLYALDGTTAGLTDSAGALIDITADRALWVPSPYPDKAAPLSTMHQGVFVSVYTSSINPAASLPLTFAFLAMATSAKELDPARDILRHERSSFGFPSFRFSINDAGKLWLGRNTNIGWEAYGTEVVMPVDQWVHCALVFHANNDVTIYMNGTANKVSLDFVGGYDFNDGSSRLFLGSAGNGPSGVAIHSLIIKNIEATDSQVDAMVAECPLP